MDVHANLLQSADTLRAGTNTIAADFTRCSPQELFQSIATPLNCMMTSHTNRLYNKVYDFLSNVSTSCSYCSPIASDSAAAPQLHPLPLLLPDCVCFISGCAHLSYCSLVVSACSLSHSRPFCAEYEVQRLQ